jgi:multidrug resistance efflux pump
VLFVAGLAAAIIYASYHWRRKSKSRETEEAEKQAVKRVYRD